MQLLRLAFSTRHIRNTVWAMAVLAAATYGAGARAQTSGASPPVDARANSCKALRSANFTGLQDAPTQIVDTRVVEAISKSPAYCRVQGYVMPQVGFELRLPIEHWNGKLLEVGDGGWGGDMYLFLCDGPLRKGYACIASDMGHKAATGLALWARNNLQAQVDFGYRATHVTALAGKAIVAAYYSRPASKSMMYGCSTGGYQGMVEAQRFPWDFDGIVAIAPDMQDEADLSMRIVWKLRNLTGRDGRPILSEPALELLHQAALSACDATDGLKDGIVGDPVSCKFDPSVLACTAGHQSQCLSAGQIAAVKNIYAGPMTSKGVRISTRGVFPGSELDWSIDAGSNAEVEEFFKYALFVPSPGPEWKITDFDFDHDYQRLGFAALYSDSNPDLRKFKSSGAKLIVAQGGNDTSEIPGAIFDYYETVERTMGGRAATADFFRLFVVPGMRHCTAGDGAFAVDYLSYLEAWVDKGEAPDKMIGAHVDTAYLLEHSEDNGGSPKDRVWLAAFKLTFPLDPDVPVTFTRPLYPYPSFAKYKGTGDATDADNFIPAGPQGR
jgi:Tannase and feruloyl esterase